MVRHRAILIRCRTRDCNSRSRPLSGPCCGVPTTGLRPSFCLLIVRCWLPAPARCPRARCCCWWPRESFHRPVGVCGSPCWRCSTWGSSSCCCSSRQSGCQGASRRLRAPSARSSCCCWDGLFWACGRRWIALATGALGVVGVAALVLGPAASLDAIGVAAAIGCAGSMATATVLARRWGRPPLSIVSLTAWQLTIGGVLVSPFVLVFEGVPPTPTVRNLAGFAVMGLFGTALAYGLWIRGVTALPASSMQFLALLSPAMATAIGWAALGQSLSPVQLVGAALVIVAVVAGQRVGRVPPRGGRIEPPPRAAHGALGRGERLTPPVRRRQGEKTPGVESFRIEPVHRSSVKQRTSGMSNGRLWGSSRRIFRKNGPQSHDTSRQEAPTPLRSDTAQTVSGAPTRLPHPSSPRVLETPAFRKHPDSRSPHNSYSQALARAPHRDPGDRCAGSLRAGELAVERVAARPEARDDRSRRASSAEDARASRLRRPP